MDHSSPNPANAAIRNKPANHEASKSAIPVQEIFEGLSLLLTIEETLQLHRYLRLKPEEEVRSLAEQCHRRSASLADSQRSSRSSLITRFSRMSLASSASTVSYELSSPSHPPSNNPVEHCSVAQESDNSSHDYSSPTPNAKSFEYDTSHPLLGLASPSVAQAASYELAEGPRAVNQASAELPVGGTYLLAKAPLPYSQAEQTPIASNICYACNKSCKYAATLAKHQTEFCERKFEWFCPICPQKVFGLQERLNRHHIDAHADDCPHGCETEKSPVEACKTQLSKCSRRVATKKAWGCPCCVKCFVTLDEWSHHVLSHPTENEKVQDWSFSTMMWSLLSQPYLSQYRTWKHWQQCTWSTLRKEARQNLLHALERQEVPAAVMAHTSYSSLDGPAALVQYAFNLSTTGKAHTRGFKAPKTRDNSSYPSQPSTRMVDSSREPPYYHNGPGVIDHSPASFRLHGGLTTFGGNVPTEREAPSFRERVSCQSDSRLKQSGQKLKESYNPQNPMLGDTIQLPAFALHGEPGYHRMNGYESRHVLKSHTVDPPYVSYPPRPPNDVSMSTSSQYYATQHSDFANPARLPHHQGDSDSRRLQTKKSQTNLHGRFTYTRDPTLQRNEAPPLPLAWQDPENVDLENGSRGLMFDQRAPQRPLTASSRPATPARSEMSQGSWTKMLNTSSPSLVRYSPAMSLSGPPSDSMSWA